MRNMAFSRTSDQLLQGVKTVTRRLGWKFLKPGERLCAVRKCQGLKKGENLERLAIIEVVDVRREPLNAITDQDCDREGFPAFFDYEFVEMFCRLYQIFPQTEITRIEFKVINYCRHHPNFCDTCGNTPCSCDIEDPWEFRDVDYGWCPDWGDPEEACLCNVDPEEACLCNVP